MDKNNFPHHTGGVVQVRHTTRYGAVPEALLEDRRLDLDSRAVAAWLAVKQDGWQILVGVLRTRLGREGQAMLGKDRWQRIANELESAGYLTRTKVNGLGGRWNWHITFTPVPEDCASGGFSGSGATSNGLPSTGSSGSGQPGHKVIQKTAVPDLATTTTDPTVVSDLVMGKNSYGLAEQNCAQELHYPKVTTSELIELKKMMPHCDVDSRQAVLDEIEGIRQKGGIKRGVVPLTRALINKIALGEFSLSAGFAIGVQRERRRQNQQAVSVAMASQEPLLSTSDEFLATLPPNIAKRVRDAAGKAGGLVAKKK